MASCLENSRKILYYHRKWVIKYGNMSKIDDNDTHAIFSSCFHQYLVFVSFISVIARVFNSPSTFTYYLDLLNFILESGLLFF